MQERYIPSDRPHAMMLEVAVNALKSTRRKVRKLLEHGTGLDRPSYTAPDGTEKVMLQVDKVAEDECAAIFRRAFGDTKIAVLGEEMLWKFKKLDLRTHHIEEYGNDRARLVPGSENRVTAILDMIDGSDLVERNFGNWCSAIIFFKPYPSPRILFSLVHNEDDTIYGADQEGTFILLPNSSKGSPLQPLKGPQVRKLVKSSLKDLPEETAQISVCFYGQKSGHFSRIPIGLLAWAESCSASERLRFYDLAGNPMMVRLAHSENIHVVFEHIGQYPHDAAPGAFIALKAGAHLVDFTGKQITENDLAMYLMAPSAAKLQYVLASTPELVDEFARALNRTSVAYRCKSSCPDGTIVARVSGPPTCSTCGKPMTEYSTADASAISSI
jgi:hypothetical protein